MTTSDRTLELGDLKCPLPIVQVQRAVMDMQAGEVLEVAASDPAFRADLKAWARKTGHEILSLEQESGGARAVVRKV